MTKYAPLLVFFALQGANAAMTSACSSGSSVPTSTLGGYLPASISSSSYPTTIRIVPPLRTSSPASYSPISISKIYPNTTSYTEGWKSTGPCTCNNNQSTPVLPACTGNSTADDWTGPDWASYSNTTYPPFPPPPGPEPEPNPITDPTVIQLVVTTQEQLILQYNTLGVIGCVIQGNTYNCQGPWIEPTDWNNDSLSKRIDQNTAISPDWVCSTYIL